jgi:tetratricopeptide (TPR) repeat protein
MRRHPLPAAVFAIGLALLALSCRSSVVPIPDGATAAAKERSPREILFVEAFHDAYSARYDDALAAIDRIAADDPTDPAPDLARAHVQCLRALLSGDIFENDPSVRSMAAAAEAALAKADARLALNPDDALALRARGYARSYIARVHVITGSTLKAVFHAQGGAADLAASLRGASAAEMEADPYLFLGFFHYMAGLSPALVRAVGSVLNLTADCDLGRKEIEYAAAHGFLYRDEANLTLAFISLLDREADYERSLSLLRDIRRRFPDNPGFALVLYMAQRKADDYDAAEATLREVLAADPAKTPEPIRLGSRVVLAGLLLEQNRFDESEAMLRSLLGEESATSDRVRARLYLGLGQIAERKGDRGRAEAMYREAEASIATALRWDQDALKREVKTRLGKPWTTDEIELRFIAGEDLRGLPASAVALANRMADRLAAEGRADGEAAAEVRYRRGRALAKLSRHAEAETDLRAAAASEAATPRVRGAARFELGRSLVGAGHAREGREELESLVAADSEKTDEKSRSLARHYLLSPAAAPPSGAVLLSPGRGPESR